MSDQPPLEPTQNAFPGGYPAPASNPYPSWDPYSRTEVGLPPLPPPPPPRKRRTWPLILGIVVVAFVVAALLGAPPVFRAIEQPGQTATAASSARQDAQATAAAAATAVRASDATATASSAAATATQESMDATATASSAAATATQESMDATATARVPTPIPLPVITTAQDLYAQFIAAGIPMGNAGDVPTSWWLQCCSYYPGRGSISFTDETSGGTMVVALFTTESGVQTDVAQLDSSTTHPGDYLVGTCLLLYWSARTNLTPYEQVMLRDCS